METMVRKVTTTWATAQRELRARQWLAWAGACQLSVRGITAPRLPLPETEPGPAQGRRACSHWFLCHVEKTTGRRGEGHSRFPRAPPCSPCPPSVSRVCVFTPCLFSTQFNSTPSEKLFLGQPDYLGFDPDVTSYCQDLFEFQLFVFKKIEISIFARVK